MKRTDPTRGLPVDRPTGVTAVRARVMNDGRQVYLTGEAVNDWTFGTFLVWMIGFFLWFAIIWMFVAVFADILRRRDLSGWAKAGWSVLILILPFLGILIYLIARPKTADEERGVVTGGVVAGGHEGGRRRPGSRSAADEIAVAAQLHEEGKITTDEFEQIKHQALRV
jgi:Phospholipase_D-nuclease N-terminal